RLEVVLGELGEIASQIESSLYELTTLYRNIVMITSRNPDHYRDYQLEERIPDLKSRLSVQIAIFEDLIEELESFSGEEGGATGFLQETLYLLNRMNDNTHHIPRLLNRYTDQLASLGEWMTDLMKQPLTVDNILIHSGNQDSAEVSPNLFQSFFHEMKKFSSTFTQDFSRVGDIHEQKSDNDEDITVWIGLGRDQGQVLKQMIEDSFSPEKGIKVKLEIIENMGSLLVPASIAGTAPDVAIGAANMELAFRDALVNLKEFEDFNEVSERFKDSAFLPFTFRDRVYGLPETQGFPMMFYRKDILEELDIDVPQTWDDIYEILPLLQRNNMSIGLGNLVSPADTEPNINTLLLFLYQNRIALYKEDGIATNLDSEASIQVTKQLADLYNLYNLPYQFNIQTRFRYGEVPIVITTYGLYNSLQVFAPELRGEWGFAPVPGIREEDGIINRAVPVGGAQLMMPGGLSGGAGVHATVPPGTTGTVIMENSDNKDLAWEFLKWWTRSDTQFRFGLELEGLMGSAARYATANIKAMEQLPWQIHEREALMEQWDWVEGIPPVLGSYYVSRQVDWLIRALILNKEPLRESVQYYNRSANVEIRRKRSEFNLETDINKLDERWKGLYWQHYTVVDRLNFDEYQEIRYLIEMPENIFE
ncbi:MAG: ABC transporter substrate-binding protein, partial [bacterium]